MTPPTAPVPVSNSDSANGSTLSGALAWAQVGPIVPVIRTPDGKKKPTIRDWPNRATSHVPTIESWWKQWPYAWIGLLTGYRSGIVALDVDPRNGGNETLPTLPNLPITRAHSTVSNGRHLLFRYAESLRSCVLGPGLDLKADGGFIVVPPSPGYEKLNNAQPVELPRWILDCVSAPQGGGFDYGHGEVSRKTNPTTSTHPLGGSKSSREYALPLDNPGKWVESLLLYCVSDVRTAPYGKRNSTLNRKAYKLGGYVAGGYLDEETVRHKLTEAALRAGLSRDEIESTLNGALTSGKFRPIRLEQFRLGEVR